MKKIMFNDRYGLTGAVLRGDNTQTGGNGGGNNNPPSGELEG